MDLTICQICSKKLEYYSVGAALMNYRCPDKHSNVFYSLKNFDVKAFSFTDLDLVSKEIFIGFHVIKNKMILAYDNEIRDIDIDLVTCTFEELKEKSKEILLFI